MIIPCVKAILNFKKPTDRKSLTSDPNYILNVRLGPVSEIWPFLDTFYDCGQTTTSNDKICTCYWFI